MQKDFAIYGKSLQNVTAFNILVKGSTTTTLTSQLTQTMYNPSNISVTGLGSVNLDVYSLSGIKIGETQVPNFQVLSGYNEVSNVLNTLTMTDQTRPVIEEFFNKWAVGENQKLKLVGPTFNEHGAEFLNNLIELEVTLLGNPQPNLIANASLGTAEFITISEQLIYNPINWPVTQTNLLFKVYQEPFGVGYAAYSLLDYYSCPSSKNLGLLVNVQPTITLQPYSYSTILMTAPGTTRNPCATFLPIINCLGLLLNNFTSSGGNSYNVTTEGVFQVSIGDFTFTQTYQQKHVPLYCGGALSNWTSLLPPSGSFGDYCQLPDEGEFCFQPWFTVDNGTYIGQTPL